MSKKKNNSINSSSPVVSKQEYPAPKQKSTIDNNLILKRFVGKELYVLLTVLLILCIIVFKDFITFEKVYLFKDIGSDSLNIYFPWLVNISEYTKANGMITWTFSQGLGQNMFPLWIGDFFSDVIVLIFNKDQLPYTLAIIEVIKVLLCGLVFFKYLDELKINRFATLVTSFLFATCGYIILGGCWTVFSTEALYVALILFGYERWLNHGKWLWFVLGITALSLLQPFYLFPYALFLAVYIPVRYYDVYGDKWNKFPVFILKTVGLSVLGVLISAYQLFPDILQYIESPRVGGESRLIDGPRAKPMFTLADDLLSFTTIFRTFSTDMLGTGSAYHGWQNYLEAPLFYCGVLCLVVIPQMFFGLNKGQKIAYGIFAGIFLLPVFFPYFRYAFWAFTGDYFRTFSFVISLIMLIFTAKALHQVFSTGKVNLIALGVTSLVLLVLLFTPNEQWAYLINSPVRSFAALLITVYTLLIVGTTRPGDIGRVSVLLLFLVCFGEMIYTSMNTVNDRDMMTSTELKERIGYNDYTVDAVKYIKERDKGFYRINKDFPSGLAIHASINDAKVQGFYGVSSYFSFNQKNYIRFLGDLDVVDTKIENATRWAMGLGRRPLLLSLVGVKYWLSKQQVNPVQNFGYDSVAKFGDVTIYRNKFTLPVGFTYDMVVNESSFKKFSLFQKDLYLLRGAVVGDEDKELLGAFKQFNLADTAVPFIMSQYELYVNALKQDTFTLTNFKESHIVGTISVQKPKLLFFSIPFDEGWKATANGKEIKLYRVNSGMTGIILPAGKTVIDLCFEPRLMKTGALVSLFGLLILGILVFLGLRANNKVTL